MLGARWKSVNVLLLCGKEHRAWWCGTCARICLGPKLFGRRLFGRTIQVPEYPGACWCREEHRGGTVPLCGRELFIDNLLVRIHFIIDMILVDWPCAMEF